MNINDLDEVINAAMITQKRINILTSEYIELLKNKENRGAIESKIDELIEYQNMYNTFTSQALHILRNKK